MTERMRRTSVVVPNWNGEHWLPGCMDSLAGQQQPADEVIVVDNGSTDGSVALLRGRYPNVIVVELHANTGFAHAANRGLALAEGELVALVNTDVVLSADWLARMVAALRADSGAASVACKMLDLRDSGRVYDAGDILSRDGVCEQRGRFAIDDGTYDAPGEVFGACAGAALYRRHALLEAGGFDERFFAYLEDVDLALRLRLAGWRCRYEPAVALHAGGGSSERHPQMLDFLVHRNTLVLVAKWFPARWLPQVLYRQLAWGWHALRERRLRTQLRATASALRMLPGVLLDRVALRRSAVLAIEVVVPALPIRGPRAGGYRAHTTFRRETR
jgi:GT2 family glycosyltransferase